MSQGLCIKGIKVIRKHNCVVPITFHQTHNPKAVCVLTDALYAENVITIIQVKICYTMLKGTMNMIHNLRGLIPVGNIGFKYFNHMFTKLSSSNHLLYDTQPLLLVASL